MNTALSFGVLVLLALSNAIPIGFGFGGNGHGGGYPGYGVSYPGYGYGYGYRVPSSSYDRSDVGASSNDWNSGDSNAWNNQDNMWGGGANHEITADKSGDSFYQGDDQRSRRLRGNDLSNGPNGDYSRNYDDNLASRDRLDNRGGFANSDADLSYGFGRDHSVLSRGSNYLDNRDDRQRSRDTADDVFSNGPGGMYQTNYRNNAASRRRNHDLGNNAFDHGDTYGNYGQNRDTWARDSRDFGHLGDGQSSFNTDLNQYGANGYGVNSRNYHNEGANADAANDRDTYAQDAYDGSRDWGRDHQRRNRLSQGRSRNDMDLRHGLTDDINDQYGPYGHKSTRDYRNAASRNNVASDDFLNRDVGDNSFNYGQDQNRFARQSDGSRSAVDNGASSRNLGYNVGNDMYGSHNTNYDNADASSLQRQDARNSNLDRGDYSNNWGWNQGAYNRGDQNNLSRGSSRASNNDNQQGNSLGGFGWY